MLRVLGHAAARDVRFSQVGFRSVVSCASANLASFLVEPPSISPAGARTCARGNMSVDLKIASAWWVLLSVAPIMSGGCAAPTDDGERSGSGTTQSALTEDEWAFTAFVPALNTSTSPF